LSLNKKSKICHWRAIKNSAHREMLANIRRAGHSCRAAWAGVNEKNLENQKRRLRLPSAAADGTTFLRFSCFFQSGMKRSTGCHFLHTFLGKQKSMTKILIG